MARHHPPEMTSAACTLTTKLAECGPITEQVMDNLQQPSSFNLTEQIEFIVKSNWFEFLPNDLTARQSCSGDADVVYDSE